MGKTKKYRIELPYFRNQGGIYYPAGSIVEIPADEKPSVTWTLVQEAPEAQVPAQPAPAVAAKTATKPAAKGEKDGV